MTAGLIVLCGPTASGKSSLALNLAEKLGTPIISADSRQVYCRFDIGTAKPKVEDRLRVPHYLIDVVSPETTFTLADYQSQTQSLITEFHNQGITPFLVGGTGLYIKSITHGLKIPQVPPQAELRSQLTALGQSVVYPWLQQVDPISSRKIHPHDGVRTLRALEVFYVTGQPLSQLQGECPPSYPILEIGLSIEDLAQQTQLIRDRTQSMIAAGWLNEIQDLIRDYGADLALLQTLGYAQLKDYLQGLYSLTEAEMKIVLHTRQFAKRQRTWFRANPAIHWFNALDDRVDLAISECIEDFLPKNWLS